VDCRYVSSIPEQDIFDSLSFLRCRMCGEPCALREAFSNLEFRESSKYYLAWREGEFCTEEVERLCATFKSVVNN